MQLVEKPMNQQVGEDEEGRGDANAKDYLVSSRTSGRLVHERGSYARKQGHTARKKMGPRSS